MKWILLIFFTSAVMAGLIYTANGWAAFSEDPVVVELFTSQSCSSCPAADKVLKDIAQRPGVIALGFHVTYWDHLGWKDTLSKSFATERQRNYAAERSSSRVYTPQMVVNGGEEFVGSDKSRLSRAISKASALSTITVDRHPQKLSLSLPELSGGPYMLWVYGVRGALVQPIRSGENRGRVRSPIPTLL
ncbi:MAG: DUF1223 domain-containing protein [Alphaproteobacteria bacterium]|nr:DUF1223 domain-containing protein [Alphaproteobacteria bacterium]MCD8570348.1 DUF1223 domain-containing protein [Alphaproteobacteria bacterium]